MKKLLTGFLILSVVSYSAALAELCHHESGESHFIDGSGHSCSAIQVDVKSTNSGCEQDHRNETERSNPSHRENHESRGANHDDHEHCSHDYLESEWMGVLNLSKELLKTPSLVTISFLNTTEISYELSKQLLHSVRILHNRAPPTQNTGTFQFTDRICLRL